MANNHDFFLSLNPLLTRFLFLRIIFIIMLSIFSSEILAENIDSLYSRALKFIDTEEWDSAIYYSNHCLDLAKLNENEDLQIKAHFVNAYSYDEKREFGTSFIEYLKAAELAEFSENPNHKKLLISLYKNISVIVRLYHHYDLSRTYIQKALKIAYSNRDTIQILGNTQNLINLLIEEEDYLEAQNLILKTIPYAESHQDFMSHMYVGLGRIKDEFGEFDSARYYYSVVFSPENPSSRHKAVAQLNYAWTYIDEERYSEAIPWLLKTEEFCLGTPDNDKLFKSNKLLGICFEKLNDLKNAEKHYLKAEKFMFLPEVETQSYTIYKNLRDLYTMKGDEHNAFHYNNLYSQQLEKHLEEQQDILIQDKKYNMQLLAERYFENLKAREIERKATVLSRNTVIISVALLMLAALAFYYRQRKTKRDIIRALTDIELNSKV